MAIAIPTLQADRLARPDWGTIAPMNRYQLSADKLLRALEDLPVPIALLRALRGLAEARTSVGVLLAADRGLLQISVDGRRATLTGPARDSVLSLLGQGPGSPTDRSSGAAAPGAAGGFDPSTAARVASVDAQVQESRLLAGTSQADLVDADSRQPAAVISEPLMADPSRDDAGKSLARAIDSSGLFLEAHLAQWLKGERSLRQIEEETQHLPVDARSRDAELSDLRGARQLDALQRQAITVTGQAWAGQPIQIEIERDRERHREAANVGDATGLFVATLTLSLPSLGWVRARIRVMENTVGVQVESEQAFILAGDLPLLASAFAARGLNLAQLDAASPEDGDR
jgi:hypothetical protein